LLANLLLLDRSENKEQYYIPTECRRYPERFSPES